MASFKITSDRSPDFGKSYMYIFNLNQIPMPNKLVLNEVI